MCDLSQYVGTHGTYGPRVMTTRRKDKETESLNKRNFTREIFGKARTKPQL